MCRNSVLLLVVVSVHVLNVAAYHWRDWNGTVPHDAVIGAVDGRGASYIARAWLPNYGIYAGQIFPEQTKITITWGIGGVSALSTTTIQVLCSDSNDVAWIASNTTLTSSLVQEGPENLVIGGITSYYDLNQLESFMTPTATLMLAVCIQIIISTGPMNWINPNSVNIMNY